MGEEKLGYNVIILRRSLKKGKKTEKKMKCERSEGVGEAQNETGERERKRVGGKGQALPWKLGAIS